MVFYSTGVKLIAKDSDVIEDLKIIAEKGVQMLVCGTCLNYFEMNDPLTVGEVSNMYDIMEAIFDADKVVYP